MEDNVLSNHQIPKVVLTVPTLCLGMPRAEVTGSSPEIRNTRADPSAPRATILLSRDGRPAMSSLDADVLVIPRYGKVIPNEIAAQSPVREPTGQYLSPSTELKLSLRQARAPRLAERRIISSTLAAHNKNPVISPPAGANIAHARRRRTRFREWSFCNGDFHK